jgi:hypothetical protein
MTSEDSQKRFYDNMLEIASQVKINAETIKIHDDLNTIDSILQIYNNKNRIFNHA